MKTFTWMVVYDKILKTQGTEAIVRFVFTALVLLVFSITGIAATKEPVTLDMKLDINGKRVSSSKIATLPGTPVTLKSESSDTKTGLLIQVTPEMTENDSVTIKSEVFEINGKERKLISSSKMIAKNGQQIVVKQSAENNKGESLTLDVVASWPK